MCVLLQLFSCVSRLIISFYGSKRFMDILDKLVDLAQLTGSADVQCLLGGQWSVRHETLQCEGLV
ncbi:TPA: AraC family transcriptional regulator, partial [Neisseria gonorrhoeae]